MSIHRWWGGICLGLLCLLCLAGCGEEKAPADSRVSGNSETPGVLGESETPVDEGWKTKGFPVSEKVEEETVLWAARYDSWQHEEIRYDPSTEEVPYERNAMVRGEQIYRLCQINSREKGGKERNLLEICDLSSGQTSVIEIDRGKLGGGNGFIADMYVAEPEKYVFRILDTQGQTDQIVYTDLGDQTEIVDILPACQEKGIADELCYECVCDAEGNIYIRDSRWRNLYIFAREGSLLMEYRGEKGDDIRDSFRMPSGELLFPVYNSEEKVCRLIWLDTEQKRAHTISSLEIYPIESVYGIQGSDIYYEAWEGIVKWNISSGRRTVVYRFDQNTKMYNTMLVLREGESPVLRMYGVVNDKKEDWLVALSGEEPEPGEAIRIASLVETGITGFDARNCAAAAARRYRNASFIFETYENAEQGNYQTSVDSSYLEDYRTRVLAELAAGGGPDILLVSLQDMRLLQSQGYLLDLRSVLSEESLSRILPNVIEMGTVNDTLAGLAPAVKTNTIITLKSIWDQDTWTLEDVLDLMDTGEFTGISCQFGLSVTTPLVVLQRLTELGLKDSSLVDWEKGKSYFDSEFFIRVLHTAKAYSGDYANPEAGLGAGRCLMEYWSMGIGSINEFYDQYGEDYCIIGFPANGRNGNYLGCGGVLAVNQNASDTEAVAAFFECMLGEEIQDSFLEIFEKSILKISPEEVEFREEGGERKAYWKKQQLRIKEDGTTTFDDYAAFLESCISSPITAGEDFIETIVWEEAEAYINGSKSAEDAARIIHSRVQLYLDENR